MKRRTRFCKLVTWLLVFAMLGTSLNFPTNAAAKKKPSLNRSRATIRVGKKVKLKVKNYKKKVKWSSSKKKVATVTAKGVVKGKKPGKAVIKAKAGKKVLKCRITVKKKQTLDPEDSEGPDSSGAPGGGGSTSTPVQTAGTQSSVAPSAGVQSSGNPQGSWNPQGSDNPQSSWNPQGSDNPQGSWNPQGSQGPQVSGELPGPTSSDGQQPVASDSTGSTQNPDMSAAPVQTSPPPLILPSEEPDPTPIVEETEEPPVTSDVTVYTYKDNNLWEDSGNTYYLKRQGSDLFEESLTVENGTYDVYVSDGKSIEDTGEDVTVEGRNRKVYIYYFTVRYFNENTPLENIEPTLVRKGQKVGEPTVIPGKVNFRFIGWCWYGPEGKYEDPVVYDFDQPVTSRVWLYTEFDYSPGSTIYTAEYYYEKPDGGYSDTADKIISDIGNVLANQRVEAPDNQEGFEPDADQENSCIVSADGTTVAKFYYKRKSYAVTWSLNGGTFNGEQQDITAEIKYDEELIPPSGIEKRGYTLAGWQDNQGTSLIANQHMPASDTVYTAVWTPVKYTVSYDLGGGIWTTDNYEKSYTIEDQTITLKAVPSRKGYDFAGWTGSNGEDIEKIVTIPTDSTGDRNYIAHWTPKQYAITYELDGGTWQSGKAGPSSYTIEDNDITLPEPVRSGHTFTGWIGSNNEKTPEKTVVIGKGSTGDKIYRAQWNVNAVTTPIPTAKATPTPTAKATATPKVTPTPTAKATATPEVTPTPTAKATATPIPTVKATATPIPTVKATATPIPTAKATATPIPTPTVTPSSQAGPTGVTFEIAYAKDNLGTEKKTSWVFHFGDSVEQIKQQFSRYIPPEADEDTNLLDEYCIREKKTPQGYTAYVCRPCGHQGVYFQIYVDQGKVVGMAAISKYFRLKDRDGKEIVSSFGVSGASCNNASGLSSNGFVTGKYKYKNNSALFKTTADYHAAAFVDPYEGHNVGKNNVYGIQIFATTDGSGNAVSADNVFETSDIFKKSRYTAEVNEEQGKELSEWAAAFRVVELSSKEDMTSRDEGDVIVDNKSAFLPVAQIHSELMASSNNLTHNTLSGEKDRIVNLSKLSTFGNYIKDNDLSELRDRLLYATFFQAKTVDGNFKKNFFTSEAIGSGSPDALGYLTWQLEDSGQAGTYADLLRNDFDLKDNVENDPFNEFYVIGGFASASGGSNFTFATLDMIGSKDPCLP